MTKATDKLLGELHGRLAKSMIAALSASEKAEALLDEYREVLPDAVTEFLESTAGTNPALLQAVSRFLKDNDITCVVEENHDMSELEQRLSNKRKRVGNVIPIEDLLQ